MKKCFRAFMGVSFVLFLTACSQKQTGPSAPAIDGSKFLLSAEPEGAKGVREVREIAHDKDNVVVVGRIGGMTDPWVEGVAAFSIVDPLVKHCHELADDGCLTPWDYC